MLKLLPLLFLFSCSQKYQTYHVIEKRSFQFGKPHNPITKRMLPKRKVTQENCESQLFWNRNAQKIAEGSIPAMVRYSCPNSDYLVNAKITETWWTTIIYSKSCIELEAYCPSSKN